MRCLVLAATLWLAGCQEPARDWPPPSPALWEVSGEHGERAWLFGTIHALPHDVSWRTPEFEQALAGSDLLLVEIGNLGDADDAAEAFEAFAVGPARPPLATRVAEADRPALAELMERAGMTDRDFWNIETWAAALMLADAARDGDPANGVDRTLLREGKAIEALESFTTQFARFDRLDEADERALLAAVAREAALDQGEERIAAWLTGDLAALEAQMDSGFLAHPKLREALLTDRNALFAASVAVRMEEGRKPFVAVGAAHMLGAEGLPALLAARGYTVTRMQ